MFGDVDQLHQLADARLAAVHKQGYTKAQLYGRDDKVYGGLNKFFLAGLSGGCYVLGTMLRFFGGKSDERAARVAFITAFPLIVICPVLLTVDLGQPLRFWHMVIDSASGGISFKYWSPMSVGVWG